jgi:hypothetical protein
MTSDNTLRSNAVASPEASASTAERTATTSLRVESGRHWNRQPTSHCELYTPRTAMHLAQHRFCHCWKDFWHPSFGIAGYRSLIFWVSSILWNPRPYVIWSQIKVTGWVLHFSNRLLDRKTARQRAPCELEHCHGGESNLWAEVQAFFLGTASCNRSNIST